MNFINYNGKIFPADAPVFTLNRAINYGDGLFETIRIHNGEILFFKDHMDRMLRATRALKLDDPEKFSDVIFHKQIIDLAHKEKVGANARVRIGIFRSGKGLYEPIENNADYFIEVLPMEKGFEWNDAPLEIGVFTDIQKNFSSISFFKSMNALPYVMAAIFKSANNLGECLLLNSERNIADAISSNLFWIKKDKVFSPPVSDGGVEGVLRKNLIKILSLKNFSFEEESITPSELKEADEVFLVNVGWGIKPVTRFEDASFTTTMTKTIFLFLLEELEV